MTQVETSSLIQDLDKVVEMVADMVADMMADVEVNKVSDVMLQFGEGVGHMGWLSGPKLFRSEAYPACASYKLCEFICSNN